MKKNEVFSASDVAKSEAKTVENGVQKSTSQSPVGWAIFMDFMVFFAHTLW